MSDSFLFVAYGTPKPKGSTRSFNRAKTGKVMTVNDCDSLPLWMNIVRTAALQARPDGWVYDGPIDLRLGFSLQRPESHPKRGRLSEHAKKPDLDKLIRAVLDALTGVAYVDDGSVSSIAAFKQYATPECVSVHVRHVQTPLSGQGV